MFAVDHNVEFVKKTRGRDARETFKNSLSELQNIFILLL